MFQHVLITPLRRFMAYLPGGTSHASGRGLATLTLMTTAGLSLVVTRGLLTGNWWFFICLTWNLFLAFVPLLTALLIRSYQERTGWQPSLRWTSANRRVAAALGVWLLFLPNAPYIITDLFHIKSIMYPLLWFDTLALFVFAQTGLLAGLYATLIVHRLLRPLLPDWRAWVMMLGCQVLSAFGVYLGRFGRWNSWDVLTQPSSLVRAVAWSWQDHLSIKVTLVYGFVLAVLYVAFYWYADYDKRA